MTTLPTQADVDRLFTPEEQQALHILLDADDALQAEFELEMQILDSANKAMKAGAVVDTPTHPMYTQVMAKYS